VRGFAYAVAQADALIRAGPRTRLVIGAEKLSDVVDPPIGSSRSCSATAPAPSSSAQRHPGISATVGLGRLEGRCRRHEPHPHEFRDGVAPWPTLRQEGPTVFRWAVWEMVKVARRPSRPPASSIRPRRVRAPPGQHAHHRRVREAAEAARDVVIGRDIETTGNTSAASIPLATHRLLEEHPELSGGLALQIGFGAGLVRRAGRRPP
jgi:3-oxoacyl-[acyl-carrier-protein] synthase-3